MNGEERDDRKHASNRKYEETILEFLDNEIAASSDRATDPKSRREEVDRLVESLLRESIASTERPDILEDSRSEDADLLFSKIIHPIKEAPQNLTETPGTANPVITEKRLIEN